MRRRRSRGGTSSPSPSTRSSATRRATSAGRSRTSPVTSRTPRPTTSRPSRRSGRTSRTGSRNRPRGRHPAMRLADHEVVREIGRGGMGVVYEVTAPDGSTRALKLVPTLDPEARQRALRERKIQGKLGEAEGFVPLLQALEVKDGLAFVMPLLRGGSLADRLARGPLPTEEALGIARTLARSVARAHALGIVHRDLKPANVLFGAKGEPLVADLGLAKETRPGGSVSSASGLTATGVFGGTLGYAPPEQLDDARKATPASDVHA